jgi:acyl-CoA synthetase (AMP-forming)/AMP-acid ligase II
MLVHELLERSAGARPDAALLVHGEETATYAEIDREANRIAHLLVARGVVPGDRIALLAENSRRYVAAFFGILKAGAVVVPLNTAGDAAAITTTLRDCGARGLVVCERLSRVAAAASPGLPDLELILVPRAEDAAAFGAEKALVSLDALRPLPGDDTPPGIRLAQSDRAAIIYTSGSTGRPKGAILRHGNIVANTQSIVSYLSLGPQDRVLVVLPFFYVYGQSLLVTHVAAGGSIALENRFLFPSVVLDTLERSKATGFAGVPSTFAILLHKTNLAQRSLPSLRYITQAGGAMAPALTREIIAALPGKRIFVMYGATEASARLAYLPPDDLAAHIGSIGRAIPDVELRVLREDGSETVVDEVGEIVARGPNIMEGYWGDPEETRRVLDENGYHTGDLARRDAEGFLWIVGRKRDMIKAGAHRISPKEIEDALLEHPALLEAAVIGVPDDLLGEAIEAHVAARPGASIDVRELDEFARGRRPAYKVPRRFVVRAELPKSAAGKVRKDALRDDASRR